MKILNSFLVVVLMLSLGVITGVNAQKNNLKKRIAVFSFQDKSSSKYQWWDSKTVGQGISEMIITDLVQSGKFRVIVPEDVRAAGQDLPFDPVAVSTPESAVEAGRALGADVSLIGVVTEFGQKQDSKNVNIGGFRVGGNSQSAVVGMDLRLLDNTTGEILFADNVRESKSSVSPDVAYRQYRFDSQQSFDESLVGKATRKAVEDAVGLIEGKIRNIPWSAKVITMDGDKVYINCGQLDGVEPGMTFRVFRLGKALTDPDTGLVLGKLDSEVGMIRVEDNTVGQGKASLCRVVNGSTFERGDVIRQE